LASTSTAIRQKKIFIEKILISEYSWGGARHAAKKGMIIKKKKKPAK